MQLIKPDKLARIAGDLESDAQQLMHRGTA